MADNLFRAPTPTDKGLPSLQIAVFGGFERRNEHRSLPLEIIGPPKVSTYLPWQMNHPVFPRKIVPHLISTDNGE
jgi:hypothetical protein